jgi:hypothetical protein
MGLNGIFQNRRRTRFSNCSCDGCRLFVFLTLKFILAGVTGSVNSIKGIIMALDKRVAAMNHDVIRIDTKVSHALGIPPDLDRIARAEQSDARRD